MGCNTSKEAMQAVETRAELAKEKLQNLTAQGENILNNLTGKDKVDSPRKDEKVVQQEEEAAKGADTTEVVGKWRTLLFYMRGVFEIARRYTLFRRLFSV